jgi:hypothetical protein
MIMMSSHINADLGSGERLLAGQFEPDAAEDACGDAPERDLEQDVHVR